MTSSAATWSCQLRTSVPLPGSRGPDAQRRQAGPGSSCYFYPGGQSQHRTINGVTAVVTRRGPFRGSPATFQVCAAHAHGLSVFISTYGNESPGQSASSGITCGSWDPIGPAGRHTLWADRWLRDAQAERHPVLLRDRLGGPAMQAGDLADDSEAQAGSGMRAGCADR